jgi:hypothetical protein
VAASIPAAVLLRGEVSARSADVWWVVAAIAAVQTAVAIASVAARRMPSGSSRA